MFDISEHRSVGGPGGYVPPAERKAAVEALRAEQVGYVPPEEPPEPPRIAGRTEAEFMVEYVLTMQAGPMAGNSEAPMAAQDAWSLLLKLVGPDDAN